MRKSTRRKSDTKRWTKKIKDKTAVVLLQRTDSPTAFKLEVNGQDISNVTTHVTMNAYAGRLPMVMVETVPMHIDFFGKAQVQVCDDNDLISRIELLKALKEMEPFNANDGDDAVYKYRVMEIVEGMNKAPIYGEWHDAKTDPPKTIDPVHVIVDGKRGNTEYHNALICDDDTFYDVDEGEWYIRGLVDDDLTVKLWSPFPNIPEWLFEEDDKHDD